MAIVNNLWLRGTKKRLAGTVVYQSMGQTIQRELAAQVTNPRTETQMQQRVRWANIVSLYRVLKPVMKYAFENKKRTQSDYNAFMSANITTSPIALTKQEAASGACVVAPYVISKGSLPPISINPEDTDWRTNIYMLEGMDLETCSVATFSKQVLASNPGMREGDQLSFVRLTQSVDDVSSVPYVILRKYEVLLDRNNADLLKNYLPAELLDTIAEGDIYHLSVLNNGGTGAFALILSRTISGRTMVSSQSLTMVNMEQMLAAYSSAEQVAGAIASYGENADAFLSSTRADHAESQYIELTPVMAQIKGEWYQAGQFFGEAEGLTGQLGRIRFNREHGASTAEVFVDLDNISLGGNNVAAVGDVVAFTFPEISAELGLQKLNQLRVKLGSRVYSIRFATLNPQG